MMASLTDEIVAICSHAHGRADGRRLVNVLEVRGCRVPEIGGRGRTELRNLNTRLQAMRRQPQAVGSSTSDLDFSRHGQS